MTRVVNFPGRFSHECETFARVALEAALSAPGAVIEFEILKREAERFRHVAFKLPLADEVTALRYAVKLALAKPSDLSRRVLLLIAASEVAAGFPALEAVTLRSVLEVAKVSAFVWSGAKAAGAATPDEAGSAPSAHEPGSGLSLSTCGVQGDRPRPRPGSCDAKGVTEPASSSVASPDASAEDET